MQFWVGGVPMKDLFNVTCVRSVECAQAQGEDLEEGC